MSYTDSEKSRDIEEGERSGINYRVYDDSKKSRTSYASHVTVKETQRELPPEVRKALNNFYTKLGRDDLV